jgi:signal transduction histidine kinase
MVQMVVNLMNNAARYTPEGGVVTVELLGQAEWAVIKVRDTGMGIPPERIESIFEIFTQANRGADGSQGGLGLGLALVRTLAQLHGGTVSAASAGPGQGSEFTLRFPRLAP